MAEINAYSLLPIPYSLPTGLFEELAQALFEGWVLEQFQGQE